MPPSEGSTTNTPLAPSVEKAYYRKCIELKRRLNEVEAANDEYKIKRVRLDRAIMKMRLERAFLLDQLNKRMEHHPDGSEGSADEGLATPPQDRPHRDKRRRPPSFHPSAGSANTSLSHPHQAPPYPQQPPSIPPHSVPGPGGVMVPANAITSENQYIYLAPGEQQTHELPRVPLSGYAPGFPPPPPLPLESPYGAPIGVPGSTGRAHVNGTNFDGADEREPMNRGAGSAGEPLSAGPSIREDSNGGRRILPLSTGNAGMDIDRHDAGRQAGFTAVNQ